MSYCRWSSDDWKCDVYCYEDCAGGWTTHVAGNKAVGEIPKTSNFCDPDFDAKKFVKEHRKQMKFLETAERKSIGLAYDGETFNDPTLEAFKERLIMLKETGYNVPAWVIESVDEEINQLDSTNNTLKRME